MDSIEFSKKCRPYNMRYRNIFGYVPYRGDYECSQAEYFNALQEAVRTQKEISAILEKKNGAKNEDCGETMLLDTLPRSRKIAEYKGIALVEKYGQYYIRFLGGPHEELLCDLKITYREAEDIMDNNEKMKNISDSYKGRVPWTKEYFISSAIRDYLFYRSRTELEK